MLHEAPAGGTWRFANPARCLKCASPISGPITKTLGEPELAKQLALRGAYVDPMSPSEVNTFINAQQAQWRPILEAFEASVRK
jgi:tripartite-type tricarboxylate transporter receptor subunit TctC